MRTQQRWHDASRTRHLKRTCAVVAAALAGTLLAAPGASAFVTIGQGSLPDVAVDAAGTAYIAWNGGGSFSTIRFCRLPRGATACDSSAASSIATTPASTSGSRPFVVVSGTRVSVVQYRYGVSASYPGSYLFTSNDSGAQFGGGVKVGNRPFTEATVGPADTMSVMAGDHFQNLPLNGPVGNPELFAALAPTHTLTGTVGLIDALTPLAVFADGSGNGSFRRYDGSGPLNDVSNWLGAFPIGSLSYPKLAGGPSGLVLISSGDSSGAIVARKWNGSDFGGAVTIGPGSSPSKHLFQDAAGRFHAVYARGDANGLHLNYAVSDDGIAWRTGTLLSQNDGGISDPRVATAPDHVGVAVWWRGPGPHSYDIRVATVGPDAPTGTVTPPPPPPPPTTPPRQPPVAPKPPVVKPKPTLTASGSVKRVARRYRIGVRGRLLLPTGVAKVLGCTGEIKVTIQRAGTTIVTKTVSVRPSCEFTFRATVARSKVRRARKLAIRLRFTANSVLSPVTKLGSINVQR